MGIGPNPKYPINFNQLFFIIKKNYININKNDATNRRFDFNKNIRKRFLW